MESVTNINEIENLKDNSFMGKPEFVNSSVRFNGKKTIYFIVKEMLS